MTVIWSGVTEEGAVVPVQVTDEGKVVAVGDGPEGDYLKLTGGNLTGDLTVNEQITLATDGSITAAGAGSFPSLALKPPSDGAAYIQATNQATGKVVANYFGDGTITLSDDLVFKTKIQLKGSDGSATFAGNIVGGDYDLNNPNVRGISLQSNGVLRAQKSDLDTFANAAFSCYRGKDQTFVINADGSASFVGDACGFTSEGEIFFTSRGARYKLFVSQGLVQAEAYTRQMELKEKSEQFIADKRETKPSEPKPLGLQPEVTPDNDNA